MSKVQACHSLNIEGGLRSILIRPKVIIYGQFIAQLIKLIKREWCLRLIRAKMFVIINEFLRVVLNDAKAYPLRCPPNTIFLSFFLFVCVRVFVFVFIWKAATLPLSIIKFNSTWKFNVPICRFSVQIFTKLKFLVCNTRKFLGSSSNSKIGQTPIWVVKALTWQVK